MKTYFLWTFAFANFDTGITYSVIANSEAEAKEKLCATTTYTPTLFLLKSMVEYPSSEEREAEEDLRQFLTNRESDIALDIEDFGMLKDAFKLKIERCAKET